MFGLPQQVCLLLIAAKFFSADGDSCVLFHPTSKDLHVERYSLATVTFNTIQACTSKPELLPDTITMVFRSFGSVQATEFKTHCQIFLDGAGECSGDGQRYAGKCECLDKGSAYIITKNVTDPRGEMWHIKGANTNESQVQPELTVKVYVNDKTSQASLATTTTAVETKTGATSAPNGDWKLDTTTLYIVIAVSASAVVIVVVTAAIACRCRKKILVVKYRYSANMNPLQSGQMANPEAQAGPSTKGVHETTTYTGSDAAKVKDEIIAAASGSGSRSMRSAPVSPGYCEVDVNTRSASFASIKPRAAPKFEIKAGSGDQYTKVVKKSERAKASMPTAGPTHGGQPSTASGPTKAVNHSANQYQEPWENTAAAFAVARVFPQGRVDDISLEPGYTSRV